MHNAFRAKTTARIVLFTLLSLTCLAIEPRKRLLIDEVLTLARSREILEQFRRQNVELVAEMLARNDGSEGAQAYRKKVRDRALEKYGEYSKELFDWHTWEQKWVALYDESFDEAQLKALVVFLKSDAGKAMLRFQQSLAGSMQAQMAASAEQGNGRVEQILRGAIDEVSREMQADDEKMLAAPFGEREERARSGDAFAQYVVGADYADGRGVEKNPAEAVKWLRLAADQGHARAQGKLGFIYMVGEGTEKDTEAARKLFLQAAERGDTLSMFYLGFMYAYGKGVEKDPKQAFPWLLKAANAGIGAAQYEVSLLYWNGQGVEQNPSEAFAWLLVAEEANVRGTAEFKKFIDGRVSREHVADGMMRSSEIRRAIKDLSKAKRR